MATDNIPRIEDIVDDLLDEKCDEFGSDVSDLGVESNPVIDSAEFVYKETALVQLNEEGIKHAATYILNQFASLTYTPSTWRTHPLHLLPPESCDLADPQSKATLDWIFLISSLNFSFWSELDGRDDRYGVEWREGWGCEARTVHTGYWSLVAALDKALEAGIPITDPAFYSSEERCPDDLIRSVFKPAPQSTETVPLLKERITIMREVGSILCSDFGGSFYGFVQEFQRRHNNMGTALQLVHMVTETFPAFRDESIYKGRHVFFWKRAQILVAETWAAFYPPDSRSPHPLFPSGAHIHNLTMFADYRVPQILHHLRILTYPSSLITKLKSHEYLPNGSPEEMSIRAASILAVERIREEIGKMIEKGDSKYGRKEGDAAVSSVLIDFYLWDLAKLVEEGEQAIEGVVTQDMVPAHRTRSIWY